MTTFFNRVEQIQGQINKAAASAGRDSAEITLIGVSKTWPIEKLVEAYEAGLRHFGENRSYELVEKRPAFEKEIASAGDVTWHFIGHLQSRQSQAVADFGDYFHATDRLKILRRLASQMQSKKRHLACLLEVNISGEASKGGFEAMTWENNSQQVAQLVEAIDFCAAAEPLSCVGLMTMAPWQASEAEIRTVFARTRRLREHLQNIIKRPLPVLSMGMSDDFEIAIEEGATHIRVGRALFGERH